MTHQYHRVIDDKTVKMSGPIYRLLMESIRRFTLHGHNYDWDIERAWTGLSYPSVYKPVVAAGMMEAVYGEVPRIVGWYRLTPFGRKVVVSIVKDRPLLESRLRMIDHFGHSGPMSPIDRIMLLDQYGIWDGSGKNFPGFTN
ncbi:MAG: hypothetical protein WC284_06320 [Candidimonas sp.]